MAGSVRSTATGRLADETQLSLASREKAEAAGAPVPTPWLTSFDWQLLTASTAFKLLLLPCYHSTDFEVHRNWLAITHSLPIRSWYFEATSQWTLDYPPFFAYFSWLLAQPAALMDPIITSVHEGLEYAAWSCKAYMRGTVIVTELVLAAALLAHSRRGPLATATQGKGEADQTRITTTQVLCASLLMHPGLIIIDHIHFQYNGFLFGVLAWSLWAAREGNPLLCAFLFSTLLNLKHIYVYIAPPFLVFLLRSYVFPIGSSFSDLSRPLERLLTVGVVTLVPFFLSLVPLAIDGLRHEAGPVGVITQMVSRLFPFSRGLIHAYWAPNAWALWTFSDRVLVKALQKAPDLRRYLPPSFSARFDALAAEGFASASRGLVENVSFGVLPDIQPSTCFLLTLACCAVYMIKLWQAPTYRTFLASISLCGFASFLFGWHVHEKAIMLVLVPYTLLAGEDYAHVRTFVLLSTTGVVSLFPLLYEPAEAPIKIIYSIVWGVIVFGTLRQRVYRPVQTNIGMMVHGLETLYLWGFLVLQLYVSVIHGLAFPSPIAADSTSLTTGPQVVNATHLPSIYTPKASLDNSPVQSIPSLTADTTASIYSPPTASTYDSSRMLELSASTSFDAVKPSPTVSDLVAAPEPIEATVPTIVIANDTTSSGPTPTADVISSATTEPASAEPSSREFLPLMMVSVYCSVGVVWTWIRVSSLYFTHGF